jgi:hypothetical protein
MIAIPWRRSKMLFIGHWSLVIDHISHLRYRGNDCDRVAAIQNDK